VRSEILEYSLTLEEAINNLLLFNLGIFDGGKATRLFGNKASISFKNKIDLLYDINVLTKEENSDLELLMIFRNKFLHDINCNSFLNVLEILDNGIKNKFKGYLKEGKTIDNEDACKAACLDLYLKNISTIKNKIKDKRIQIEERSEIFQLLNQQIINHHDLFFDLIKDLFLILENSELEDDKLRALSVVISEKLQEAVKTLETGASFTEVKNKLEHFTNNPEKLNNYFSVARSSNNNKANGISTININPNSEE